MTIDLRLDPAEVVLFTDLYELTVGAAFFAHGMNDAAPLEVGVRRLPPRPPAGVGSGCAAQGGAVVWPAPRRR